LHGAGCSLLCAGTVYDDELDRTFPYGANITTTLSKDEDIAAHSVRKIFALLFSISKNHDTPVLVRSFNTPAIAVKSSL
jgi:hypothetical protein